MIAYRMLYAVAVGVPILIAVALAAATLRRHGRAERGTWLAGLLLVSLLPAALMVRPLYSAPSGVDATGGAGTGVVPAPSSAEDGGLLFGTLIVEQGPEVRPGLERLLLLTWLLASAGLALRWGVSARRLARASASWQARTVDGSDVWVTPDSGPAVTGVLRTRIVLPDWLLTLPAEERSLVLLHEEEHIGARDPWLMTLSRVTRILTPWNPIVWIVSARLLRAVELDCDRRVLLRRPDVRKYCDTLFAISARQPNRLVGAAAFAEPRIPLRRRIVSMTTPPRSLSTVTVLLLLALGGVLVVGSCGVPLPTERDAQLRPSILEAPGVMHVSVDRDGEVLIDDQPYSMEDVSVVAAGRVESSPEPLVTSIYADANVPYRYMDPLLRRLVEAGAFRVTFVAGGIGDRLADPEGFSIVLPESGAPVSVSQRNLLKLEVQPSGTIDARRGESVQVQRLQVRHIAPHWRQEVLSNPLLIASVTAHRDASYAQVLDVLDELHAANAQRISLRGVEVR